MVGFDVAREADTRALTEPVLAPLAAVFGYLKSEEITVTTRLPS